MRYLIINTKNEIVFCGDSETLDLVQNFAKNYVKEHPGIFVSIWSFVSDVTKGE